jgi:hypothetical protein
MISLVSAHAQQVDLQVHINVFLHHVPTWRLITITSLSHSMKSLIDGCKACNKSTVLLAVQITTLPVSLHTMHLSICKLIHLGRPLWSWQGIKQDRCKTASNTIFHWSVRPHYTANNNNLDSQKFWFDGQYDGLFYQRGLAQGCRCCMMVSRS